MMHGREKSGLAVVAVKPANKAERSAAELAEPRAGAEANARRQSTHRVQSRTSMSQASEGLRRAATALRGHTPEIGAVCPNWARTESVRGALSNGRC
jgi:hypothetical protein